MFGISIGEIIVVLVLLIIFVPPEQIPKLVSSALSLASQAKKTLESAREKINQQIIVSEFIGDNPSKERPKASKSSGLQKQPKGYNKQGQRTQRKATRGKS